MTKKIFSTVMILTGLIILGTNSVYAGDTFIVEDDLDDVIKSEEGIEKGEVSFSDIDIKKVSCSKEDNSKEVTITMELNEDGELRKSIDTTYSIFLIVTSSPIAYLITYWGIFEELGSPLIIYTLFGGEEDLIEPNDYSVENNVLTMSFDLATSKAKCISLSSMSNSSSGNIEYIDAAPDMASFELLINLSPSSGGPYETTAGKPINFNGSLFDGNPENYSWLWVFNNNNIEITGQKPSYTFTVPGDYEGHLFVYNDEGVWGYDSVYVTVNESTTDGGGGNGSPGFETIMVIGAIAIALILMRKKRSNK